MMAIFERLTGFVLLDPWFLVAALLVPVAIVLRVRQGEPAITFGPATLLPGAADSDRRIKVPWRVRLLPLPRVLQVTGLLLAVIALARPVERSPLPLETEGIDILLCLDVSSSMAARDLDESRSRLEVARSAAARFVAERPHDRIGVLRFARYPDLRCPLTLDHEALADFVTEIEMVERDGPEDATGIGTAVARAAQVLRDSEAPSRVVVLLTDGEENVATEQTPDEIAPLHAAQLCADLGVRVYTVVVGRGDVGPLGESVPLDSRQVRALAIRTGGRFFEAQDAGSLENVYAAIDRLETMRFSEPRFEVEERFMLFVFAALGLLLMARVLGATVLEVLP